MIYN
jgi:hypothetical protein